MAHESGKGENINAHIIFGEWWLFDLNEIESSLLSLQSVQFLKELRQESNEVVSLCRLNIEDAPGGKVTVFPRENLQFHVGFPRILQVYDSLLEEFIFARRVVGSSVKEFGCRFSKKWPREKTLISTCDEILKSLRGGFRGEVDHILDSLIIKVSKNVAQYGDLALFPPLPLECPPQIWINPLLERTFLEDPLGGMKICLLLFHEILGHLVQHRLNVIGNTRGKVLNMEEMEGWGIVAESVLSEFGIIESAVVSLYRLKRLLPIGKEFMAVDEWNAYLRRMKAIWPEFFEKKEFALFRRATRRHAMGLLRMELMGIQSLSLGRRYPNYVPWS